MGNDINIKLLSAGKFFNNKAANNLGTTFSTAFYEAGVRASNSYKEDLRKMNLANRKSKFEELFKPIIITTGMDDDVVYQDKLVEGKLLKTYYIVKDLFYIEANSQVENLFAQLVIKKEFRYHDDTYRAVIGVNIQGKINFGDKYYTEGVILFDKFNESKFDSWMVNITNNLKPYAYGWIGYKKSIEGKMQKSIDILEGA